MVVYYKEEAQLVAYLRVPHDASHTKIGKLATGHFLGHVQQELAVILVRLA